MKGALMLRVRHAVSRVLHVYADWRIGATDAEKRCYKKTDSILLTFDDYGTEAEIGDILAILSAERVKAMFFPIGSWAEQHPALMQQLRGSGHVIGNHTYSHPNLLKLSEAALAREIEGGIQSRWLRAPQGRANSRVRRLAQQRGYALCYWSIDSRDWTGATVAEMRHTILTELHPGAVILFHFHGAHTRELLPQLISDIRARGYTLTGPGETW